MNFLKCEKKTSSYLTRMYKYPQIQYKSGPFLNHKKKNNVSYFLYNIIHFCLVSMSSLCILRLLENKLGNMITGT